MNCPGCQSSIAGLPGTGWYVCPHCGRSYYFYDGVPKESSAPYTYKHQPFIDMPFACDLAAQLAVAGMSYAATREYTRASALRYAQFCKTIAQELLQCPPQS
jgi:hypothetical protein